MKNKLKYLIGLPVLLLCSCNDFLDLDNFQNVPTDDAYKTVQDVQNGMNGMYYAFGYYYFYGRNVVALGDMAADNAVASASTGHFLSINRYNFSDTDGNLDEIWLGGYQVLDRATRTIAGAKAVLEKAGALHLSDKDVASLHSYISQCYALRALSQHVLVNVFALPYKAGEANSQLGIVLPGEEPIPSFTKVERATVDATYANILADIAESAKWYTYVDNYNLNNEDDVILPDQYYMNRAAIYALEARVSLYMENYNRAIVAADSAVILRNATEISNEAYLKMWSSTAISDEDIFTIAKSENDNLSANSLNTLYGSYRGALTDTVVKIFGADDVRLKLIDIKTRHPKKFDGIPTSQAVNNIPVFRISEMKLIEAEAYAHLNNTGEAQKALLYTAKRNPAITAVTDLPSGTADLLDFIAQERRREFFEEGFRWYDARRTGMLISVSNGSYKDFNVAAFVYPIPASEVNAGFGVVQNPDWENNMPS
ncbi:RagB/SusD family nutrient uptake outer membrane protein [uncultured Culturomica sp.]|uniref:RagB/SusD family nutrient uptake outer membrane protein n=1 Tax=uncultured Culturomica sp. TaxID=1926654 RepID=UPI000335519E|nr:RagB/SusD family nutrient uptake outer membrane protein [uncultured Culturomica sp.]CCZ09626.1 putative uncharacterized protein [Odoribacter sp. CAG:788]